VLLCLGLDTNCSFHAYPQSRIIITIRLDLGSK